MRSSTILMLCLATALLCTSGCEDSRPRSIRLATTTSTDNSGLLGAVIPPFEQSSGMDVKIIAVGSGQALEIARRGDADIIIVHAREREDAFVAEGAGVDRRDLMWNDFVIIGPADDPARVRGLDDAAAALRRIAETGAPFASRDDDSGTHIREQALWRDADAGAGDPPYFRSTAYLRTGLGMGKTLVIASEKRAYTLTDRGTWLAFRGKLELDVLVEGDARLRNPYGIILVNPEQHEGVHHEGARSLQRYLLSPEGQKRIAEFQVDDERLFHPARSLPAEGSLPDEGAD